MTDPIRVIIDQQQLDEIRNLIYSTRKGADTALYRALNYGTRQGRKAAVDRMAAKANLTKAKIREQSPVFFASVSRLEAQLRIKSKAFGIEEFKKTSISTTGKGVAFRIWVDGPRERYRHAFMAQMPGAKSEYVYERNLEHPAYNGRTPLKRKYGPSMSTVYENTPGVDENVRTTAADKMLAELSRQINLLIGI
jgi:hypothetical protein